MKKILTLLSLLLFFAFVLSGLYIFGLPPFQEGGPFYPKTQPEKTQPQPEPIAAPDNLPEAKVGRSKTYIEHLQRASLLAQNNYNGLAIAEYQEAIKMDATKPEPFLEIGKIHLRNNEYADAQTSFEEALKIDASQVETQVYLVRSLLGQRKMEEAKNILDKISVENQNVQYYQGIVAAYFGDYDKSKNYLTKAAAMTTSKDISNKAQNFLNAYSEFDFNQGAEKTHLKALLGRSFNQTGEYQMAIPLMFEVIKEKKDYRDAWILLGYAYLHLEKYQDALEAFNEGKKLDPEKPETLFFLGISYYGLNNLQEAASMLELAKKNGFQPAIQVDQKLAEIYLQLKDYNKSAENYENVVSLNDNDIHYYIRPIWIYLEKTNQPTKALTLAEKAFARHPNEAMSFNLLAWAQMNNNQTEDAEKNLTNALNLDPKLDAAYLNFGLLSEKKGELDKALAYYRKAHTMGSGNSISASAAERYNVLIAKTKNLNGEYFKANVFTP